MLAIRVIPCLDVKEGRVVKGVRFEGLRDMGDPAELAARYEEEGADELVFLDVSATAEGRNTFLPTVERVRSAISIPLCVGGGVRVLEDARRLLDAGADKVSVNSAALRSPDLVPSIAGKYGRQCAVVAIDAFRGVCIASSRPRWELVIDSGRTPTGIEAVAWARRAEALGAGEILLTSRDRDGTGEGFDLDLLAAVTSAVAVPVVASGGAAGPVHLKDALGAGASAVLAASMFHERRFSVAEVKRYLSRSGFEVRI